MRNVTNIGMVYNGWRSVLLLGKPHILLLLLLGKNFSQTTATSALRGTYLLLTVPLSAADVIITHDRWEEFWVGKK